MTDDAADTHTYDVHMADLPGALGWASTRGPASTATHRIATCTANDRRCLRDLRHGLPIPMGALGWASAQGPALAAPRAVQRPLGGPPPEGVDNFTGGRAMTTASPVYDRLRR